jgi:hypothetical protein
MYQAIPICASPCSDYFSWNVYAPETHQLAIGNWPLARDIRIVCCQPGFSDVRRCRRSRAIPAILQAFRSVFATLLVWHSRPRLWLLNFHRRERQFHMSRLVWNCGGLSSLRVAALGCSTSVVDWNGFIELTLVFLFLLPSAIPNPATHSQSSLSPGSPLSPAQSTARCIPCHPRGWGHW